MLTLLTLGVFAAWAKVRRRRYLRGSTRFLGHAFDYRARPARILAGNVIVAALFVAYALFGQVYPLVALVTLAVAACLAPWIIVRSLSFNAHNTVYRGMRFYFRPNYAAAAVTCLLKPLLLIPTFGLYYPAWVRGQRKFAVENHRLGDAFFSLHAPAGHFFQACLFAGLIIAAAVGLGLGLIAVLAVINTAAGGGGPPAWAQYAFLCLYLPGFYIAQQLAHARVFNHVWNHVRLDEHRFRATLGTWQWIRLQCVNAAAIVCSLGLLYPWALMRATRYKLSRIEFIRAGPVENIRRFAEARGNAVGEAAGELFGFDFGL